MTWVHRSAGGATDAVRVATLRQGRAPGRVHTLARRERGEQFSVPNISVHARGHAVVACSQFIPPVVTPSPGPQEFRVKAAFLRTAR